jgi:hypothetical protein
LIKPPIFRTASADLFGQFTDFFRDDGESSTRLSCTGSFYSRVQSQQVGLIGYRRDSFRYLADLL